MVLPAIFLLASAGSDRWVELRRMNGDRVFVDAWSMPDQRGKSGEPWVKIVYARTKANGETSHLWRYAVSCGSMSVAAVSSVANYRDGHSTRSDSPLNQAEFQDPAPDSFGEYLVDLLCKTP
jgi:hypothetical protein